MSYLSTLLTTVFKNGAPRTEWTRSRACLGFKQVNRDRKQLIAQLSVKTRSPIGEPDQLSLIISNLVLHEKNMYNRTQYENVFVKSMHAMDRKLPTSSCGGNTCHYISHVKLSMYNYAFTP